MSMPLVPFLILAAALVLSVACGSGAPTPTPEPTAAPPPPSPTAAPTSTFSPTPTPEPEFALAPATGVEIRWHTWPELRASQGEGTGPWVTLPTTDHTGKREFWLQVVCWPKESTRDLSDRTLAVMVAEIITDPDTIAALKSAPLPEGYYQVGVLLDEKDAGEHGWLYEISEGSTSEYYYAEMLTANEETSGELIARLTSGDVKGLAATVWWYGVGDRREFDVTGAKEVLAPVVEGCEK